MKRVKYLIYVLFLFCVGVSISNAASLKVSSNKKTVIVGNTVTVTVSASGAAGWEYCLNYDTSLFTLTSSTSDTKGACVRTGSTLIGYSKVTYTLKAKKSGSGTIGLRDAVMYGDDGNSVSATKGSVSVVAKTQAEIEASYSTDANLSKIEISGYDLSPKFDKNTLNYSLDVENDVDSIVIKVTKSDSSASVSGAGEKELTEGINKFKIVVTAEKGNKKTYEIEINRKELNPINVNVEGEQYTIVRKSDALVAPNYYSLTEIEVNGDKVPALKSEISGYILLGLKDDVGNISLFLYDELTQSYKEYKQISTDNFVLVIKEAQTLIKGYEKTQILDIGNEKVTVYVGEKESDFVFVYGMNAKTGKSSWYKYDKKDETLQRYEEILTYGKNSEKDLYLILIIIFVFVSTISILLVIVLLISNSKIRKKNNKLIYMLENSRMVKISKAKVSEKKVDKEKNQKEDKFLKSKDNNELSQRELRRLEKEKAKKNQEELEKAQDDYLKVIDDK